ncbi:MAG: VacJ family lipoprotein [Campylobacterota bacterium]|nr:VacJ family lipoprotein [Campylobacterota bacterium]
MRFLLLLSFFTIAIATAKPGLNIEDRENAAIEVQETEAFDDFADEFDDEFAEDDKASEEIFDPLSGYNRLMTDFNDVLLINVVDPATDGYRFVVPEGGRESVYNFFQNLYYPVSFANNLLQFKLVHAGNETLRFMINSTIGLLGLFDPAEDWFGIEPHIEDFGQTLGSYGVGSGFPVVLPFFGQRNLRDLTGTFVDGVVDPIYYVDDRFYNLVEPYWQSILIRGYEDFNEYSLTPGAYQKLTEDAIDLYPFLRDSYEQYRNNLIAE